MPSADETLVKLRSHPDSRTDAEFETWLRKVDAANKSAARNDMANTLAMAAIGGGLAFWAYMTIAHAVLFFFLCFSISAMANRITGQMRADRVAAEHERHLDRLYPDTVKRN